MALTTTLAACSTNEALNNPQGGDLPASLDDQIRYALRFIAELRDGAALPVGAIFQFPTTTAPQGYLKMNGALVSRATYAALWAFASTAGPTTEAIWSSGYSGMFSVGDGSTTFRLPDWRGCFSRGLDEGRGLDAGRAFGNFQDHVNVSHNHAMYDPGHAHGIYDPGHTHGAVTDAQGNHAHNYTKTDVTTGAGAGFGATNVYGIQGGVTDAQGLHAHNVTVGAAATGIQTYAAGVAVQTIAQGGVDGHPRNQAAPFYIKY